MTIIRKHCNVNLVLCDFGNLCGLASAAIWLFVLVPQLVLNWKRKSVEGLSILWAAAMFTASFVHAFYLYNKNFYVFFKIGCVFVPVLCFALLVQFWAYSQSPSQLKVSFAAGCFVFYGAILTLELAVPTGSAAKLEWIAIVFYSVELLPQITLNMTYRSTVGQATFSVILSAVARTLSFLYYYLLVFENQFQVMQYYIASAGLINLMQLIWYPKPRALRKRKHPQEYGSTSGDEEVQPAEEGVAEGGTKESTEGSPQSMATYEEPQGIQDINISTSKHAHGYFDRIRKMSKGYLFLLFCMLAGQASFAASLCIISNSLWGLLAPTSLLVFLMVTVMLRNYREGRLHCCDQGYPEIRYKSFVQ